MKKNVLLAALLTAGVLSALGCSQSSEESDAAGGESDALKSGKPTTAHPEIGRVELDGSGWPDKELTKSLCTGVLIRPRIVATAGCGFGTLVQRGGAFFIDTDANGDGKVDKTYRYAVQASDHIDHRPSARSDRHYFEFVLLTAPVPASVAKPIALRRTPIADKERVTAFGYGAPSGGPGWGPKNTAAFSYSIEAGPEVLQGEGDYGAAALDAQGALAAVGRKPASHSFFFGTTSDDWIEPGRDYEELEAFVADLEKN